MTILKNKKINLIKEKGKLVIMQPSLQFFGIVSKNPLQRKGMTAIPKIIYSALVT